MEAASTGEDPADVVRRAEDAADAWVRGDMDRYLELVHHAPGFTLLAPFGGPPSRHGSRAEGVRATAGYFADGEATLEHVETPPGVTPSSWP